MPERVLGDGGRLRQVLANLIGNAVKFTERGEVAVTVSFSQLTEVSMELVIVVTDTGIGISDEAMTRLFEPFSQADTSTSRRYGGTGLGLAISRRLVELMGGQLAVTSSVNYGSAFTIRIPVRPPSEPQKRTPRMARRNPAPRALIVDDCATVRRAVGRLLSSEGFEIEEAESGLAAYERLTMAGTGRAAPDVVLVDAQLGDVAGLDLARGLAGTPAAASPPVILLCPLGWHDGRSESEHPWPRIRKPVRRAELRAALAIATGGNRTPASDAPARVAAGAARPVPWRALVVEDNAVNQLVAVRLLRRLGGDVTAVASGAEAIVRCAMEPFDVIFMDCQMPEMDGYETTRLLRAAASTNRNPTTPIVALTANALSDDRQRCLDAGMDDYLSKPVRLEELRTAVERWTNKTGDSANETGVAVTADASDAPCAVTSVSRSRGTVG
jgi:two-component system sensor histidine kinase/response regulator